MTPEGRKNLAEIGQALLAHSKKFPIRQHVWLKALAPSIMEAAKRMSARKIAAHLTSRGFKVTQVTISRLLKKSWN